MISKLQSALFSDLTAEDLPRSMGEFLGASVKKVEVSYYSLKKGEVR